MGHAADVLGPQKSVCKLEFVRQFQAVKIGLRASVVGGKLPPVNIC